MSRSALVLFIAVPLAAADLIWKHVAVTPAWAYHPRGAGWLLLSLALVAAAVLAGQIRSRAAGIAAGVTAGGLLGNALSAAWNGMRVPDPIVIVGQRTVFAFNLADVFTSAGILALTAVLSAALIRNRHALPPRRRSSA